MYRKIAVSLLCLPFLMGSSLPKVVPVPDKKPITSDDTKLPVPTDKQEKQDATPPGDAAPLPTEKPATTTPSAKDTTKPDEELKEEAKPENKTDAKPEPVLTIKPEDGQAYAACLVDLKAMGTVFEEVPRIDDGNGCGIDKPLKVSTVLPGIVLKPEGTIRCETALELARWTKDSVLPAADAALEEDGPLVSINQASSYVCRLRNNAKTGKISEHARGNAIDIASFTFKSGKSIEIQPRDDDATLAGAFQRAVTATGCLYFETVLDPGSDEAHENHLHFDVIERKGGYRFCR